MAGPISGGGGRTQKMGAQPQAQATKGDPEVWREILAQIGRVVSKPQFATWFPSVCARVVSRERLELEVPNVFIKSWLVQHYQKVIQEATSRVLNATPEIIFHVVLAAEPVAPEPAPTATTSFPASVSVGNDDASSFSLNEEYTFENFAVGQSNRLAYGAAQLVAEAPSHTYNPLFLYGDVGLGKTHLLQAICHEFKRKHPHLKLRYISCEAFTNDFIAALATKQAKMIDRFRERYRKVDVLLVDDIHFLAGKSSTQEEFYHTFNALFSDKKQIVLSSDGPPEAIPTIEERLRSRIKWGMVASIEKPDYETRVLILKKKSELRGTPFPNDIVTFLASHIDTNVRALEGAVVKLNGHALITHRPITVDLAREVFKEYLREAGSPVSLEEIQSVVTGHYQVRLAELQSKKRNKAVAFPRQICMYLARRLTANSLEEIGRYFGGRDHSTVIYACDQMARHIDEDPQLRWQIDAFTAKLKRKS